MTTEYQLGLLRRDFASIYPPNGGMGPDMATIDKCSVVFLIDDTKSATLHEKQSQLIRALSDRSTCIVTHTLISENETQASLIKRFEDVPGDITARGFGDESDAPPHYQMIMSDKLECELAQQSRALLSSLENQIDSVARLFQRALRTGEMWMQNGEFRASDKVREGANLLLNDGRIFKEREELYRTRVRLAEYDKCAELETIKLGESIRDQYIVGRAPRFENIIQDLLCRYQRLFFICTEECLAGNNILFAFLGSQNICSMTLAPNTRLTQIASSDTFAAIYNMEIVQLNVHDILGNPGCSLQIPRQFLHHFSEEVKRTVPSPKPPLKFLDPVDFYKMAEMGTSPNFAANAIVNITGVNQFVFDAESIAEYSFIKLQIREASNPEAIASMQSSCIELLLNSLFLTYRFCNVPKIVTRGQLTSDLSIVDHKWVLSLTSTEDFTFDLTDKTIHVTVPYLYRRMAYLGLSGFNPFTLTMGRTVVFDDSVVDAESTAESKWSREKYLAEFVGKSLQESGEYTASKTRSSRLSLTATTDVQFTLTVDNSSNKRKEIPINGSSSSDEDSDTLEQPKKAKSDSNDEIFAT